MGKRFIVVNESHGYRRFISLYDCTCFGLESMALGMDQYSIECPRGKAYYLKIWHPSDDDCGTIYRAKLNVIDEFDTLEEVEKKYDISEKPISIYETLGYIKPVAVSMIKTNEI